MSVSSAFLWRFLDDVWDILPTEDRQLFEAYWSAQLQIAANIEQKTIEAALSTEISKVPVFLTERWNRFVMNEDNCDLFQQADVLELVMEDTVALSRETAFFDTLVVSVASGQIYHEETMRFFDGGVRGLRYGKIVKGSISLTVGGKEYTQNRDYVVNLETGTIQALDDGRIPTTESATIRYHHAEYTRDLDYEIDETRSTIRRLTGTTIPDGDEVVATYTYNGTATLPLASSSGSIVYSTLTDLNQNFSALIPGRTLTITSGPNAGTYAINSVINPTSLQISGSFVADQASDVIYTINAFPHGVKVDKTIVSIPHLRNTVDGPTSVMVENVDYVVSSGLLSVRAPFPVSALGPEDIRERQMWAETTKVDKETPYRNFGVLIDFYRANSEAYKLALQGLWYTFWTGSTPNNLRRGLHILLGLPFAKKAGTVSRVSSGQVDVTDPRGQIITYSIPSGLEATCAVGDEVARFESLTTGVQIVDRNNEPGFVSSRLGRAGIERFLTSKATRGTGNTDETKALLLLENHLFMPQVLAEAISQRVNVTELVTFLNNMKPKWTTYVFSIAAEEEDELVISEDEVPPAPDLEIDLTTTVANNQWNQTFQFNNFLLNRITGEIISGGTQATGNFRDVSVNFTTLGIDAGDTLIISEGIFQGFYVILERINDITLSLDIPDEMITGALDVDYQVIPQERALDNDSVNLGRENVILTGANFLAPADLNTKTDIDLAGTSLSNGEIKALLLVDVTNAGAEVQEIIAADKDLNEIEVDTPPTPAATAHEICSCSLQRTDNAGPTVTHAYAI